jgi:hypothetical protein
MKVIKPVTITQAMLVSTTATESVASWNAATAYTAGQKVLRTTTQRIYQRIIAGTTSTIPELDFTNWVDIAPSNTFAMFDGERSTQTSAASNLQVTIKPGIVNSICLFGLEGTNLTITIRDGLSGPVIYTTSKVLDGTIITDYYQYFFEPSVQLGTIFLTGLPPYSNAHITVSITSTGTPKCGILLVGTFYDLGSSQYGVTSSIIDYSKKDTDQFGVTTFVKRAFSDRISCSLILDNLTINKVKSILNSVRATPCAWITTDAQEFESLSTYGFYKDFTITVPYPSHSLCSLEIEGLI